MLRTDARIYTDGVRLNPEAEEKINQIATAVKTMATNSDVSMRFLKNGHVYEGLLWGKANGVPIGVYKRGMSLTQVLENMHKRVTRECITALRSKPGRYSGSGLPMAA